MGPGIISLAHASFSLQPGLGFIPSPTFLFLQSAKFFLGPCFNKLKQLLNK
jgi:hypothetical protein